MLKPELASDAGELLRLTNEKADYDAELLKLYEEWEKFSTNVTTASKSLSK